MEGGFEMRRFEWKEIPMEEYMYGGIVSCQGCAAALAMRLALKALGGKAAMSIPACCWTIISGEFPYHALKVPVFHTAFETAAITAAGMRAGFDIQGKKDVVTMAWAGDGGTVDIGIQALSGVAERNENIIYVCYDNEAYMNTGIQRSGATPLKAWTTTTPYKRPNPRPKKNIDEIMAAHRIPYVATLSPAYPVDFVEKFKKAKKIVGTRFLHIISPCPPGWKTPSEISIKLARLAVETCVFPLYEIRNGEEYTITYLPKKKVPVVEYLRLQGRFKHLKENDIEEIQRNVDKNWELLLKKHLLSHPEDKEKIEKYLKK